MPGDGYVQTFWKRVSLRLLTSPITLYPLLLGATLLLAAWAFSLKAGLMVFTAVVSLLVGLGTFFTRLFAGGEDIQKEVLGELQTETETAQEKALDDLEAELERDGDPRTEQSLRELRVLTAAFKKGEMWAADINTQSRVDITTDVNHLFHTSVEYLKKTLEIWDTAHRVETPAIRESMLDRREALIEEVRRGIDHISSILTQLQTLGVDDVSGSSIRRVRGELDASLEVAKRVRERIASWDHNEYDTLEHGSS